MRKDERRAEAELLPITESEREKERERLFALYDGRCLHHCRDLRRRPRLFIYCAHTSFTFHFAQALSAAHQSRETYREKIVSARCRRTQKNLIGYWFFLQAALIISFFLIHKTAFAIIHV